MEAQKKRNISTSTQYDGYIKKADNKTNLIKADAGIPDTIVLMKSVIKESTLQAAALAQVLRGENKYDTCRNVWNFFYDNVQYTRDEKGKEQVRTFNRMYLDRFRGVDCDCYTVSICALLINLGIESYIRIAAYSKKTGFQHVYVVVVDETQPRGYLIIDPVMENFDAEHPFIYKEDYKIRANYQRLEGLETEKNINFTIMQDKYLGQNRANTDSNELDGIFDTLLSAGISLIPGGGLVNSIVGGAGGASGILSTITSSLSSVGSMIGIGKNAAGKAEAQAATQKVKEEVIRLKATLPGQFAQAQAAVAATKAGFDSELNALRATLASI